MGTDKTKAADRQATGDKFTRDMFAWLNQVRSDPEITAAGFMVAFAISQYINRKSLKAWPSQKTLAGLARVTARAVQKTIDKLIERGHLSIEIGGGVRLG